MSAVLRPKVERGSLHSTPPTMSLTRPLCRLARASARRCRLSPTPALGNALPLSCRGAPSRSLSILSTRAVHPAAPALATTRSPTTATTTHLTPRRFFAKKKKKKSKAPKQAEGAATLEDSIPLPGDSDDEDAAEPDESALVSFEDDPVDASVVRMERCVEKATADLQRLRAARAAPSQLEFVTFEAYGARTTLREVAHIATRGAQLLAVTPHDTSLAQDIAQAIRTADPGTNPQVEGRAILVTYPKPSAEMRAALIKQAGKVAERARTRVRGVRQKAMNQLKKDKDEWTEDDMHRLEKEIQAETDKHVKAIDTLLKQREKDISEV